MDILRCHNDEISLWRNVAIRTYEETFAKDNTPENNRAYIESAFSMEKLGAELAHPASDVFLARVDGRVAGYLKVNQAPAQTDVNDDDSLEIERIYLLREFHGTGRGKTLLDTALAYAGTLGKAYAWLGVWEHNRRAMRFYEKNGFVRFGSHVFQLGDEAQVDYLMRKDLGEG